MTTLDVIRNELRRLEHEAEVAKLAVERKRKELRAAEKACCHVWGPVVDDSIRTPSYTIPADEYGVGGIDHRGPTYVPASVTKRWKRTCTVCGKKCQNELFPPLPLSSPGDFGNLSECLLTLLPHADINQPCQPHVVADNNPGR
jgi:hypothetical protein